MDKPLCVWIILSGGVEIKLGTLGTLVYHSIPHPEVHEIFRGHWKPAHWKFCPVCGGEIVVMDDESQPPTGEPS